MLFFSRFQELSEEKGMSTSAVATQLGIPKTTVTYWRQNPAAAPKTEQLLKIAQFFHVSTDYLLGNTDIKNPPGDLSAEEVAKVALFGGAEDVSEQAWSEVEDFVKYIKQKYNM
ncbi:MAG: helix-turn-helix transcriptional regulator [Clostridia bacterium]|nr:helix-turn-helix transcriptional regulator [Clostridia bacterium]